MQRTIPFLALLLLAGCATDGNNNPPPDVQVQCIPMVTYSPEDQNEFAAEVSALDSSKNLQIIRFLGDYHAMRQADEACKK